MRAIRAKELSERFTRAIVIVQRELFGIGSLDDIDYS